MNFHFQKLCSELLQHKQCHCEALWLQFLLVAVNWAVSCSLQPPRTCCTPYTATHIGEFQRGTKAHSTHSTISGTCWQWHCSGCSKVDQVLCACGDCTLERPCMSDYIQRSFPGERLYNHLFPRSGWLNELCSGIDSACSLWQSVCSWRCGPLTRGW